MDAIMPRIETLVHREDYGKFVVEPVESGFGTTLGNSLRRVLLSSVEGAAVTTVKMGGVLHEFSTIPGVREDAAALLLNLKALAVKVHRNADSTQQSWTLRIHRQGEGEVTAADIETPEDVEIVNPEIHLAYLSDDDAVLDMEMIVEIGKGYVLPERMTSYKHVIGSIPIGAAFTPVTKASFVAEPTRVGGRTDLERLVLEIWTNGTVSPQQAIGRAAQIYEDYLRLFLQFGQDGQTSFAREGVMADAEEIKAPDIRIEEMDFSNRTFNCLRKAGIMTVRDLVQRSEKDLSEIRNFGTKALQEVRQKLNGMELTLKGGPTEDIGDLGDEADDEDDEEQ
ncbi:MAG: DNA-directed RNA polymerase subunit alpha [Armatimonadetes bacterium]|nr:DNA-directed RNA polymerase subunit alpha [Armatimonadota bacterium]